MTNSADPVPLILLFFLHANYHISNLPKPFLFSNYLDSMPKDDEYENIATQEDECLALKAIYDSDFVFTSHIPKQVGTSASTHNFSGCLTIAIPLPSPWTISFLSENEEKEIDDLTVEHLPPIVLQFRMPPGYPLQAAIDVDPECSWMDEIMRERLREFVRNFANVAFANGDVALFQIADAVNGLAENQENFGVLTPGSGKLSLPSYDSSGTSLRATLECHDMVLRQALFAENTFTCGICIEENLKGRQCILLPMCGHVFCRQCLEGYFTMLIREGMVSSVGCPDPVCAKVAKTKQAIEMRATPLKDSLSGLPSELLVSVVGPEMEKRYRALIWKQRIEADPSYIFCPRLACQSPVKRESLEEKLGVCDRCGFAFCTFCHRTWHGKQNYCKVSNIQRIALEYLAADEQTKIFLELKYGESCLKELLIEYEQEQATEKWKSENTVVCPHCSVNVEKSYGCNHMTCKICSTHFCYLCSSYIDPSNPYRHFNDPKSPCHSRLFEGANTDPDFELI